MDEVDFVDKISNINLWTATYICFTGFLFGFQQ